MSLFCRKNATLSLAVITLCLAALPLASCGGDSGGDNGAPTTGNLLYVADFGDNTMTGYRVRSSDGVLFRLSQSPFQVGTEPVAVKTVLNKFVYVTNSGSNNVSGFSIGSSGALTAISGSPFTVGVAPEFLTTDTAGKFLFVSNSTSGTISVFAIDPTSGVLTAVAGSPFTAVACSTASAHRLKPFVHPNGAFLYLPDCVANSVRVFSIGSNGALSPLGSFLTGGLDPITVQGDPNGKFLYAVNFGSNDISAFTINSTTGALTAVPNSPFAAGTMPTNIAVNPGGSFAYVANSGGNSVIEYAVNTTTGALTFGSSFTVAPGLSPEFLVVDPSGAWLFVANHGSDNISAFAIQSDGALAAISGSPFAARSAPHGLDIASQ